MKTIQYRVFNPTYPIELPCGCIIVPDGEGCNIPVNYPEHGWILLSVGRACAKCAEYNDPMDIQQHVMRADLGPGWAEV